MRGHRQARLASGGDGLHQSLKRCAVPCGLSAQFHSPKFNYLVGHHYRRGEGAKTYRHSTPYLSPTVCCIALPMRCLSSSVNVVFSAFSKISDSMARCQQEG